MGGICHSPVEGGRELCTTGSSSENILKPLLDEFEVGMATPIPPFLAERTSWPTKLKMLLLLLLLLLFLLLLLLILFLF